MRINPVEEWECRSCCCQVVVLLLSGRTWGASLNIYLPASVFPAWHPADADGPSETGRFAFWWIQTGACEIKHGRSTAICRQRCAQRDNDQGNGLATWALYMKLQLWVFSTWLESGKKKYCHHYSDYCHCLCACVSFLTTLEAISRVLIWTVRANRRE